MLVKQLLSKHRVNILFNTDGYGEFLAEDLAIVNGSCKVS